MRKGDLISIVRRMLGRLSFSFVIVAFLLAWEGYKRYHAAGDVMDGHTLMDFVAAMLCVMSALLGVRERHRAD